MTRRLLNLLTVPSLLLCGAVVALWVRSYQVADIISPPWTPGMRRSLISEKGSVAMGRWSVAPYRQQPVDSYRRQWRWQREPDSPYLMLARSGQMSHRVSFPGFRFSGVDSWGVGVRVWELRFWALFLLAAALPAARATTYWRHGRRSIQGLCPACGYDLRASPGRCPECGRSSRMVQLKGSTREMKVQGLASLLLRCARPPRNRWRDQGAFAMRFPIGVSATVLLACSLAPAAAPPADPLKGLTQKEAQERVISALKERDAKLANVRYVVREHLFNVDADGGREERVDKLVELRRHARGHWMRQARYKVGENEPYWEQITSVRAGGGRIFTRDLVKNEMVAGPHPGEAMTFRSFWFNEVVGFRATDDGPPRTVAGWVEDAARTPPRTVTCSMGVLKGRSAVALVVSDGSQQSKTLWLDPSRDWMTVRTDYFGGSQTSYNWSVIEVEKEEAVNGVWFPLQALCRSGSTRSSGCFTEIHYTVEAAAIGKVTEADLDVPIVPKAAAKDQPATPRR